jgi:hypothetical protein
MEPSRDPKMTLIITGMVQAMVKEVTRGHGEETHSHEDPVAANESRLMRTLLMMYAGYAARDWIGTCRLVLDKLEALE